MARIAIFIDGGYIQNIFRKLNTKYDNLDFEKLIQWISGKNIIFRTYYYDCLPYQSATPTKKERNLLSKKQKFFNSLDKISHFCIRRGKLVYRGKNSEGKPIFVQKRVDLKLGLDIGFLVYNNKVDLITIVTGDSDFMPIVKIAQDYGIIVNLIHGPKLTYHEELWRQVDERKEINETNLKSFLK